MAGRLVDVVRCSLFDDAASEHHGNRVGELSHNGQIMGNEQVGQVELVLQISQEIEDLSLDRNIQGRDRLIEHKQPWLKHKGSGDGDALALPA